MFELINEVGIDVTSSSPLAGFTKDDIMGDLPEKIVPDDMKSALKTLADPDHFILFKVKRRDAVLYLEYYEKDLLLIQYHVDYDGKEEK